MTDLENKMTDLEKGLKAFNDEDYKTAYSILKPLAMKGEAEAEFALGFMFEIGLGFVKHDSEMFKWYQRAAERGHADAQVKVGKIYHKDGETDKRNYKIAGELFIKAAKQGNVDAQYNLASMYESAEGIIVDNIRAHQWYNLAASAGHKEAAVARDLLATKMSSDDLYAAHEMALNWFEANLEPAT